MSADAMNVNQSNTNTTLTVLFGFNESGVPLLSIISNIISYIALIISTLMYVAFYKYKEFHNPGYALLIQYNVAGILASVLPVNLLLFNLALIQRYCKRFTSPYWINLVVMAFAVWFYWVQVFVMFIMAFQRYCAVIYYNMYKNWFSKKNIFILLVCTLIVSALPALPCLVGPCQLYYEPSVFNIRTNFQHPATVVFFSFNTIVNLIVAGLVVFFYTGLFIAHRRLKNNTTLIQNRGSSISIFSKEFKLALQMFIATLLWVLQCLMYNVPGLLLEGGLIPLDIGLHLTDSTVLVASTRMLIEDCIYLIMIKSLRTKVGRLVCCCLLNKISTNPGSDSIETSGQANAVSSRVNT